MRVKFLSQRHIENEIKRLLDTATTIRLAVAYWGEGATDRRAHVNPSFFATGMKISCHRSDSTPRDGEIADVSVGVRAVAREGVGEAPPARFRKGYALPPRDAFRTFA